MSKYHVVIGFNYDSETIKIPRIENISYTILDALSRHFGGLPQSMETVQFEIKKID